MSNYKKPLGRSIAFGCVLFTAILCVALSVLNYFYQRNAMYNRYQSYIGDILRYVDRHIDDEDMKHCIDTGVESPKYRLTLRFMDQIMNEFSIHYLYAIKPLNLNATANVMSVLSAEDDYNRYEDTEGNLYLGWVSDDEFDVATVQQFFDIMAQDGIVFFVEKTEWSTDYTGAMPLRTADGEAYAVLAVDVDITTLSGELLRHAVDNTGVIMLLGLIYTVTFLWWTRRNITNPVKLLEKGVVDYAGRSQGQRDVEALKFQAPVIRTDNEVESLSKAITRMTENMQDYVSDILSAEENSRSMKSLAEAMRELATIDDLTGVRNKTAYSREVEKLDREREENADIHFGMAMIDLNYLKYINDNFGHEKGNQALCALRAIICEVFAHSPVFRVGGDEFIVILRGRDYRNIEKLSAEFRARANGSKENEPWEHVSAALGVALYDPEIDHNVDDVLKRADINMYAMKTAMKATRQD